MSQCQNVDSASASACSAYSSKASQAAQAANQAVADNNAASNTGSAASATPQSSAQPDLASNQWGCASDPNGQLCQTCMANSSQQVCSQQPDPTGASGFQNNGTDPVAKNASAFNVPDPTGGLSTNPYQQQNPYQQNPYAQQQQMAGVPNGGGGGGFGGANGQGANLGSRSSGGYAPPSGNRADIMQGERGGGFAGYGSGPNNSTNEFNTASNFRRGAARAPASGTGGYLGMDLKRYLPGGMFDPHRQVGGMYRTNSEILGQTADLFRHVSDRIQEHCRLGYLFDCR